MLWFLRKIIILIVLFKFLEADDMDEIQKSMSHRITKMDIVSDVERCTRRFSPGKCSKPVSSVWTFDIQSQICIERLGCLSISRANRFPQFEDCRRSCDEVKHLYRRVHLADLNTKRDNDSGADQPETILTRRDDVGNYVNLEVEEEERTQKGREWFSSRILSDPEDRSNIRDVDPVLSEDVFIDVDSF